MKCSCSYGVRKILVSWQGYRGDIYLLKIIQYLVFSFGLLFFHCIAMLNMTYIFFMKRVGCLKLFNSEYLNKKMHILKIKEPFYNSISCANGFILQFLMLYKRLFTLDSPLLHSASPRAIMKYLG